MADPLLFLTRNKLYSFIKQLLLLNPNTSLYRLFTETDALLAKTYAPENTLHLTREIFSIIFCVLCWLSFHWISEPEGIQPAETERLKTFSESQTTSFSIFVNSPRFCLDPSRLDHGKCTRKVSASSLVIVHAESSNSGNPF